VGGELFAHPQSRTSGHTALLFFPFVFQLLWRIVFAGGGRQCWLWGRGACLYIFRRLLLASVFCCQHQKYFPSRKKIKEEKNWVAGRKKLLIGNRSVRPRVLQLSLGHPSTFACSLRCQPTSSIFFLSICPRRIVFAFNCGIKNTPEYVVLRLVLAVSLFMAPVRLCRQSISFLVLASAFWSVFARSPLTLCGRGRVNGYSIYLPHSRKQALEAMKMI